MSRLPDEWEVIATHVRWPDPVLERTYLAGGDVLVETPDGDTVVRSDTVADDVVDDLEKGAPL